MNAKNTHATILMQWALVLAMLITDVSAAGFTAANTPVQLGSVNSEANIMLMIDNSGSMESNNVSGTSPAKTRITVAVETAKSLIDNLGGNLRVGLSTYWERNPTYNTAYCTDHSDSCRGKTAANAECDNNTSSSDPVGILLYPVSTLTPERKTGIQSALDNLCADGATPLATTQNMIGRYFTTGYTGNLTLHPEGSATKAAGATSTTKTVAQAFPTNITNSSGENYSSPITTACQQSFSVLITDGDPNENIIDSNSSGTVTGGNIQRGLLSDCIALYDGYKPSKCGSRALSSKPTDSSIDNNALLGVSEALFEMDLRPDLDSYQNNIKTYLVGFAGVTTAGQTLMQNVANKSGGQYFTATTATDLANALNSIITHINDRIASTTGLVSSSQYIDSGGTIYLYQTQVYNKDWSGSISSFSVTVDSATQIVNIEPGWTTDQAGKIPAHASRSIYTKNASGNLVPFSWGNLTCQQQTYLNTAPTATPNLAGCAADGTGTPGAGDGRGQLRLSWLRGDQAQEATGATPRFRARTRILGDISGSTPIYIGKENLGYASFDSSYATFMTNKTTRTPLVMVGANDGMYHAFRTDTGVEVFAYVPNAVFPNLSALMDTNYGGTVPHRFFVDGTSTRGDAKITPPGGSLGWRSVAVDSLGAGGKAMFALDFTDLLADVSGTTTSTTNVKLLWEKDSASTGWSNLGYVLGAPTMTRIRSNYFSNTVNATPWAVTFGNGYNSANDRAVLFVVDLQTGNIGDTFDTSVGALSTPNGLSAPTVYMAGSAGRTDQYVGSSNHSDPYGDAIYAGDLQGNVWAFKYDSSAGSSADHHWVSKYKIGTTALPLFTTPSSTGNAQPITAQVKIGGSPNGQGVMVYFGTGSLYFNGPGPTYSDGSSTTVQSLYGIWDVGTISSGLSTADARRQLLQQTILYRGGTPEVSVTSTNPNTGSFAIGAPDQTTGTQCVHSCYGWYLDLTCAACTAGERVLAPASLSSGHVFFATLTPSGDSCHPQGVFRLIEVDPKTGGGTFPLVDTNGDRIVTQEDRVTITLADGTEVQANPNQTILGNGGQPLIVKVAPDYILPLAADPNSQSPNSGSLINTTGTGRTSWRQIFEN